MLTNCTYSIRIINYKDNNTKFIYASSINNIDLYNHEIISYEIGDRPQISIVSAMLIKAFKQLKQMDKLTLRSDQSCW